MESGLAGLCRLAGPFCHNSNVTCVQDQSRALFSLVQVVCCRYSRAPSMARGRTRWRQAVGRGRRGLLLPQYCIIKVESAATGPVMRPCSCRLQKGCNLLQRRPALIDLYDPYPANRGLMRRDLWAKVLGAGGRCASRMRGLSVAFPPRPPAPFHLPPSNPSRLQEIPRSKGGLAQWID